MKISLKINKILKDIIKQISNFLKKLKDKFN
jgi:hypothetical protein